MRTNERKAGRAVGSALVAAAGLVVVVFGLSTAVRLSVSRPEIGDIVTFAASVTPPVDDGVRLLVHRQGQFGCVLDVNVLRRSGGSVVIETQLGEGAFRAHWAGTRTSDDPGNCGGDSDLIVNHLDLDILAIAAGGYGVGPNRRLVFPGSAGNEDALAGR